MYLPLRRGGRTIFRSSTLNEAGYCTHPNKWTGRRHETSSIFAGTSPRYSGVNSALPIELDPRIGSLVS